MVKTVIGDTLTVEELIEELKKFPKDMPTCTDGYTNIIEVRIHTWENSHPYHTAPDTDFVMIE